LVLRSSILSVPDGIEEQPIENKSHRPRKTAVKIFFIAASLCLICFGKTPAIQSRFYMHDLDRAIILCKNYARRRRVEAGEGTKKLEFGRKAVSLNCFFIRIYASLTKCRAQRGRGWNRGRKSY
jgi:hypothetical protein